MRTDLDAPKKQKKNYMRTDAQKKPRKNNLRTGATATKHPDKTI